MRGALHDYHTSVSFGRGSLINLHIADDIVLMAGINSELQTHADKLTACASACEMETITDKKKMSWLPPKDLAK